MNETITIEQFIEECRISMTCEQVDSNPDMTDSTSMDHWRCTLKLGTLRMCVHFSMGKGHNGNPPELTDVLNCLVSDARAVAERDFEEWADDYGFDSDSRRAERIYQNITVQSRRLESFLGEELYQKLLWETEPQ